MNQAIRNLRQWMRDPNAFVRDNFHVTPDRWQAEVLSMLGQPGRKRIALRSCAGPGKTSILAWAGWHRLACFADPNEHPKGSAVSITGDNLRDNLWAEMARWQAESAFLLEAFQWQKERISNRDHPETWFLAAKSWAKAADSETIGRTLSGLHARYPFYLIDESGDMPPQMFARPSRA